MRRVTADTNIYISGLNFRGKPFEFLQLARAGAIDVAISEPILVEVRRVLQLKFHWPEDEVTEIERQIGRFTRRVVPEQTVDVIKDDPTDNRILECAAAARSDFIVTGDKHLLQL